MFLRILACVAVGYLLGSVMSAILISKLVYREDVRKLGSGNSGATNAARVYGAVIGFATYFGDFLKCVIACLIGRLIGGWDGETAKLCLAVAGAACILGHSFPVFFRFKGGKGVASGSGFALMLDWRIFVISLGVFLIVALITKRVSAGSIAGCASVAVCVAIFVRNPTAMILGILSALLVIAMHWQNIDRLAKGQEKPFAFGKPKKPPRVR